MTEQERTVIPLTKPFTTPDGTPLELVVQDSRSADDANDGRRDVASGYLMLDGKNYWDEYLVPGSPKPRRGSLRVSVSAWPDWTDGKITGYSPFSRGSSAWFENLTDTKGGTNVLAQVSKWFEDHPEWMEPLDPEAKRERFLSRAIGEVRVDYHTLGNAINDYLREGGDRQVIMSALLETFETKLREWRR